MDQNDNNPDGRFNPDTSFLPTKEEYNEDTLNNWRDQLRYIRGDTRYLNISARLLESSTHKLLNLKYLDIFFNYNYEKLKELLSNIHNAPLLKYVKLNRTPMSLADLEKLHDSLPKLEELYLSVEPFTDEGEENIVIFVAKATSCVKSLTLVGAVIDTIELLCDWISYIGDKYATALETLNLFYGYCLDSDNEQQQLDMIQSHMVSTLSRLSHLKNIKEMYTLIYQGRSYKKHLVKVVQS